jgi:hypothetical protein
MALNWCETFDCTILVHNCTNMVFLLDSFFQATGSEVLQSEAQLKAVRMRMSAPELAQKLHKLSVDF